MNLIVEDEEITLAEIDILSEEDKNKLLYTFNNTTDEYKKDKTIQELFEEQVERTPNHVAAVFKEQTLTYKELNNKANQLARVLRGKGVKVGSIVGIMVERSIEMLVGIMGILKSGGAYLPIDPEYPKERISFMLEDSKAEMLLTQKSVMRKINFNGTTILTEELEQTHSSTEGCSIVKQINTAEDLAYIIYTSGSTGKPKGVMIAHNAVNNFIKGITERIEFAEGKKLYWDSLPCALIYLCLRHYYR